MTHTPRTALNKIPGKIPGKIPWFPFDFPPLRPKLKPWLAGFNWAKISWPVTIHRLVAEQCWASSVPWEFRKCWHCAFEAQPGMNFLALASTVVTPHNHTVRIARNLSRRRCKYDQICANGIFTRVSSPWYQRFMVKLCTTRSLLTKYHQISMLRQPFCSSPGKTGVHLATAPGKPGTWLNLKKLPSHDARCHLGITTYGREGTHIWLGFHDQAPGPHRIAKLLCLEPILKGGQKNNPKASPGINHVYCIHNPKVYGRFLLNDNWVYHLCQIGSEVWDCQVWVKDEFQPDRGSGGVTVTAADPRDVYGSKLGYSILENPRISDLIDSKKFHVVNRH